MAFNNLLGYRMRISRLSLSALAITFLWSMAPAQGVNTQLVGTMNLHPGGYSNCWGYVANGREYAIMGCFTGTSIVDITSDTLKEVAFISGIHSSWREIKTYQHYAYVVTEGTGAGEGVQIIDLGTLPDSAKLVNTYKPNGTFRRAHSVAQEGKYLYLNGGDHASGGTIACDLSDPVHPVQVGEYEAEYVHDCIVVRDTMYAAEIYGIGLDIVDVTDKSKMKRITLVQYPGAGTHNTDLTADGRYVFTTDEIGTAGTYLRVWDRTKLDNVHLAGTYQTAPQTIIHNIHVKGDIAYISYYSDGLRIVDIRNPEIPVEIASYDTYPGSTNSYNGAWGTFPYYVSNKVIISDIQTGLYVVRFPGQDGSVKAARIAVTVKDSVTGVPVGEAKVEILGTSTTKSTDVFGKFSYGTVNDTITVRISKSNYWSGYESKTLKIPLVFGTTLAQTILLRPMPSGVLSGTVRKKENSQPIPAIAISVNRTPLRTVSDSSGHFVLPSLLADSSYTVVASRFGYAPDSTHIKIVAGKDSVITLLLNSRIVDNFESDLGWTVGSAQDSGLYGIWARGIPARWIIPGDTVQPGEDHTPGGTSCYTTGDPEVLSNGLDGRKTLLSPSFDPVAMTDPIIQYWRWFYTSSTQHDDSLIVQVSNDNGSKWKTAEALTAKQNRWTAHQLRIKDLLPVTSAMKVRFIITTSHPPKNVRGLIDDFEVGDNLPVEAAGQRTDPVPLTFGLSQNYPNPFNPLTYLRFTISNMQFVQLKIVDVLGREVALLVNERKPQGNYEVAWDAGKFPSGVYFYQLKAGDFVKTMKMVVLK